MAILVCFFNGKSPCLMGESSIYGYFIVFLMERSTMFNGRIIYLWLFYCVFDGKIHHV